MKLEQWKKLIVESGGLRLRHHALLHLGIVPKKLFETFYDQFAEAMQLIAGFMDDQCQYNKFLEDEFGVAFNDDAIADQETYQRGVYQ